ncbi:MAG: T9SS type A sorting domain-containing protein [Candidatus Bipolaricaulota bacterium]|nr:T9SS type A sorting domain-containing protein [Candidatus Bipolaricaulota bacterium]
MGSRSRRRASLVAVLSLAAVVILSTVAMAEITRHADGGEAQWWYREKHDEVCLDNPTAPGDYCAVADHWGMELATYFEGNWAYMALDCAKRFLLEDVVAGPGLGFEYVMLGTVQSDSGPSLAFLLFSGGNYYLAVSEAAPNPGTLADHTCAPFDAGAADWWWGSVEMADSDTVDPSTITVADTGTFAELQTAYGAYSVVEVLVLMGVVGEQVGCSNVASPQDIHIGKTVVDDVKLNWTEGIIAHGGVYRIEPSWYEKELEDGLSWENAGGFDDWTQAPGSGEPAREWDRWCLCDHCLQIDDQNLWNLVSESDFVGVGVPTGADEFPSPDYALYFGNKETGDYDMGEASVGVVCSPWNEINPGDQYVSISFEYFREVEQYMGAYDWTYVQVLFDDWSDLDYDPFTVSNPGDVEDCNGGDWKTVWYKDSSDANEGDWAEATITHYLDADEEAYTDDEYRVIVPPHATRMRIRFGFNSVDGASNDSFGWLIDNIVKTHSPDPTGCLICTDYLPQATIGEKYDVDLCPQVIDGAATGARSWAIKSVVKDGERSSLPRRLALDSIGRLYGEPDPGTSGTYEITFVLTCIEGRPQTKTLTLNIRTPSGSGSANEIDYSQDFDDCPTASAQPPCCANWDTWQNSATWTVEGDPIPSVPSDPENLWHETGHVKYALTGDAECEYGHVAYFGQYDDGTTSDPEDPNFAVGRAKGCLLSAWYAIKEAYDGEELIVGFKSWRNVEYFTGGEYDKTWVDMRFEGGAWRTIWSKSSTNKSEAAWTWQEAHTGILLKEGVKIQLRFCFDSIDGSGNAKAGEAYGWLIDEVTLYAGSAELGISNCPKAEASVGEYYDEELTAAGGSDSIVPIWEIASGTLPSGLGLTVDSTDRRTAYIQGTPRASGSFTFTLRVRDEAWNEVATRTCTIVVGQEVSLLFEDFENDPSWGLGGLWHFTADTGVTGVDDLGAGNHAAYYGQHDNTTTPDYNTDARTTGTLTLVSPVIDLTVGSGVEAFKVVFDYWRAVENFTNGGYDKTQIQVRLDDGDWRTIWTADSGTASTEEWERDVSAGTYLTGGAETMTIRFLFDSVDKWYNDYVGWLVDNLKVRSASASGAATLPTKSEEKSASRDVAGSLDVMNVPNPVKDVHTTTFMVRNTEVEAMRIVIYDLSGTLVYEEEIAGNELVWHTENSYGEFLANGIYLYRAYVLINGEWIQTKVQKLVILR